MLPQIATRLRFLQLYAHNAHHGCQGQTFWQDHEVLGELYQAYTEEYDQVVEKALAVGEPVDLLEIQRQAVQRLVTAGKPQDPKAAFLNLLEEEKRLQEQIGRAVRSASQGTVNLLGQIADSSELRASYKLARRLA